jgi:hypothetical protein
MVKKEGSTSNQVKHLHESTLKMLLFASVKDSKTIPTKSCKRIINSRTALAEQDINTQFEDQRMTEVSFSSAYKLNMYHGILLWSSSNTPSNHSPFSFAEAEPIHIDEQKNFHLTLQLILTQG